MDIGGKVIPELTAQLRRIRRQRMMTQAKLAARMGYDRGYICKLETGARRPSIKTLFDWIEALGCRAVVVPLALVDEPPSPTSPSARSAA